MTRNLGNSRVLVVGFGADHGDAFTNGHKAQTVEALEVLSSRVRLSAVAEAPTLLSAVRSASTV